ncbi:MAG: cell division protein FtsQ/DivIB [Holosporales bacterium]|nr:cell division protein FtsQ/DivIB [Holosporales bacterium]
MDGKAGVSKSLGAGKHRKSRNYFLTLRLLKWSLIVGLLLCVFLLDWPSRLKRLSETVGLSFKTLDVSIVTSESRCQEPDPAYENAVRGILDLKKSALFCIDLKEKQRLLEDKLPWIKTVVIARRLPDTIRVHIIKRMPTARWQHNYRCYLVDEDGVVLSDDNEACKARADLPLVIGEGGPMEAQTLFDELRLYPELSQRIISSARVGRRRWDIYTKQTKIMLPEGKLKAALAKLNDLHKSLSILDCDISVIDMRIAGRYVIKGNQAKALLEKTKISGKEI